MCKVMIAQKLFGQKQKYGVIFMIIELEAD